eukprot:193319-Pelagomonas_calceolata.AAC.3
MASGTPSLLPQKGCRAQVCLCRIRATTSMQWIERQMSMEHTTLKYQLAHGCCSAHQAIYNYCLEPENEPKHFQLHKFNDSHPASALHTGRNT